MSDESKTSSSGRDRGKLFSAGAMDRLRALNRAKLRDQLTTADRLGAPGGRNARAAGRGQPGGATDLGSLCPGTVLDGRQGTCYLVEGRAGDLVPGGAEFEVEYRRTFVGGGMNAVAEALHESVRPLVETPVEGIVCLDIETCGLAGMPVFQVGLLGWRDGTVVIRQFMARDYSEEPALLARVWEALEPVGVLVTFNGASFDVPFLEDRSAATGLGPRRLGARHVDLLHEARRRWRGVLPNCRLQTIERFVCGRIRSGDIPGDLIPSVYHEFVRTGDARQIEAVLRHNAQDLVTLAEVAVCILQGRDNGWL